MEIPQRNSPWQSLFYLLVLTLVCSLLSQFLASFGYVIFSGHYREILAGDTSMAFLQSPVFLYISLAVSSLGTFLFPALILQKLERNQSTYFQTKPTKIGVYLMLLFVFLIVSSPVMELITLWNKNMSLPDLLKPIETWMQEKEQSMGKLVESIIMVDSVGLLLLNLLIMAVIPAIVEEFFFRGAFQGIMYRLLRNPHVAIWITAIVFSAIHVQFYGFLPRMFLGLFFGYAYYWTKNIWVAVFGHFVNNAAVTLLAYYYHKQGKTIAELEQTVTFVSYHYIISLFLSVAIGYYFYQLTQKTHEYKQS